MKWTEIPAGDINAANQRLWVSIGSFASEVVAAINANPAFADQMAIHIVTSAYDLGVVDKSMSMTSLNPQWLKARNIMGENFFGVEDVIKHFGVNPTKQQLAVLAEIPWSEEVLISCKDTHVLVAVFPLSILDIRGHARKQSDQTIFYSQDWYNKQPFAKDKGEIGWQLVGKVPVAKSIRKTWNEQQALLSKDEETPKAQVVVYTMVSHFLNTGERLFEKFYVRCADLDSEEGSHVYVGHFDTCGLSFDPWFDNLPYVHIGLSVSMKQ